MNKSIVLSIGQRFHLKHGKDRIVYAGMPSDDVYSIVQIKNAAFNNALAWNLYYPRRCSEITIDGVQIFLENVTPEEIRLRVG